jgi:hypothetical protein
MRLFSPATGVSVCETNKAFSGAASQTSEQKPLAHTRRLWFRQPLRANSAQRGFKRNPNPGAIETWPG